jgi:hypothetical protein
MANFQTLIGLITLLPWILKDLDDPVGVSQVKPKDLQRSYDFIVVKTSKTHNMQEIPVITQLVAVFQ